MNKDVDSHPTLNANTEYSLSFLSQSPQSMQQLEFLINNVEATKWKRLIDIVRCNRCRHGCYMERSF
jgi:hypothetical protein